MSKHKHYKLGTHATSFYDPSTKLSLAPAKAGKIPENQNNEKLQVALKHGHIIEITEAEHDAINEGKSFEPKVEKKKEKAEVTKSAEELALEEKNLAISEKTKTLSELGIDELIEEAESTDWDGQELKDFEEAIKSKNKPKLKKEAIENLATKLVG